METRPPIEPDIKVGVSSCLLGENVRYDGGHRLDHWITGTLGEFVTLVPVCPEVEVGMGVPRETVRLEGDSAAPRMIAPGSGDDWTARMNRYARRRVRELDGEDLCGYIFKKNSPSCGVLRVKVYDEHGRASRSSRGLFATAFAEHFPLVPVEDEGRLLDAGLRENFIERVFAFRRLRDTFGGRWKRGDVVDFHNREKYLLMAHGPRHFKQLGQLMAAVAHHTPTAFRNCYMELFMEALAKKPTMRRHVRVLRHMAKHLKKRLDEEERQRIRAVIDDFGTGSVPLIVPMTLLRHYIELDEAPWVEDQSYLNPHPKELMLPNHV